MNIPGFHYSAAELRVVRRGLGLTMAEFGNLIGLGVTSISCYESGMLSVPRAIASRVRAMEREADRQVRVLYAQAEDEGLVLLGEPGGVTAGFPRGWQDAIAFRVRERMHVPVVETELHHWRSEDAIPSGVPLSPSGVLAG